ncbi:MAG: contractile injection system protein, VgrG/Pvc8 family [Actinomycetota bacterium]|nr:contractile injection system protein, VgrG/Pvc8 family [Actinomycetota bacterium]
MTAERLTPAYRITLGDTTVDTTEEPRASSLVGLTASLDLDAACDACTLTLGGDWATLPEVDDEARIELGYADDDLTLVLTGVVAAVEERLTGARVVVHDNGALLVRTFHDETYQSRTAGAIVRDLAGKAGVDTGVVQDGIDFPAYVVDGRRSAHHHVRTLARLCGFETYLQPGGELVFERYVGGKTVHVFEHAEHLLEVHTGERAPRAETVEAWGEGTGRSGGQRWAWLTKDFTPSRGTAGLGGTKLLVERPALRTAAAARTVAQATLDDIDNRTVSGTLRSSGRAQVALGDALRIAGVPRDGVDGSYQVRGVTHRLDKRRGFVTTVSFRSWGSLR